MSQRTEGFQSAFVACVVLAAIGVALENARLLAQTQYALFETFEADETDEEREDVRLEMEARLRDSDKTRLNP